jgi:hypothetical protein
MFTREELLPLARSQLEALVEIILACRSDWNNWRSGSRGWKPNWLRTAKTAISPLPVTV